MDKLEKLIQRIRDYQAKCQEIRDAAEAEDRDFTPEECKQLDECLVAINAAQEQKQKLEEILENERRLAEEQVRAKDKAKGSQSQSVRITPVASAHDRQRWGFDSFGDYLKSVIVSSAKGNAVDKRLIANAPTTVGTEGSGPDGGFAVPPDYRSDIQKLIMGEDSLLSRTDQQVSSSNTFTVPSDETTPWQTSGGILTYWTGENTQLTESKPSLKELTLKLHKLTCLVPLSEELMQDAPSMETYVRAKAAEKINFEINRVLIHGTGAGQPLGLLNSEALVTVAKDSGQTADTITFTNLVNMWSRCYGPVRNRAVWLMNQDIEPQILSLVVASAYQTAYLPPGGLSGSPYSTLFGRPMIPTQACETLGDKGDIFLVDLGSYLTVSKALRQDMSIHLYFDYDVTAFRFILRLAGQPWWSAAMSARDGSATYSPYVTLAERA